MKKLKSTTSMIIIILIMMSFNFSFGQSLEDALGFSETVNDVPEAPIHLLISLFLGIGVFLGIKKLK